MSRTDSHEQLRIIKDLGKGATEVWYYGPALLLVAIYALPDWSLWLWLFTLPLCYAAGGRIGMKWARPRLITRLAFALGIGLLHASALFLLSGAGGAWLVEWLAGMLTASFIAYRGMSMSLRGWQASFPNMLMLASILSFVMIQPFIFIWLERLAPYKDALVLGGVLAIIGYAYIANERHLQSETSEAVSPAAARSFKRQNRLLTSILVVLLILLALFRRIQQAVESWVQQWLSGLMAWFNRPREQAVEEAPPSSQPPMDWAAGEPPNEPAAWMQLLERLLQIVVTAALLIAAAVVLFYAGRKLYRAAVQLVQRLMGRGNAEQPAEGEFVDEVESLMDWTKWKKQMRSRLSKLSPGAGDDGASWERLTTNGDRIRYLYAKQLELWKRAGQEGEPHLTPRETIETMTGHLGDEKIKRQYKDFATAYEEVRYGEKQPQDDQVAAGKKLVDGK